MMQRDEIRFDGAAHDDTKRMAVTYDRRMRMCVCLMVLYPQESSGLLWLVGPAG